MKKLLFLLFFIFATLESTCLANPFFGLMAGKVEGTPPPAGGPVTYIGHTLTQQSSGSTVAVTIPSDATGIIVIATGYAGGNHLFSQLNFDNGATLDFTHIVGNTWSPSSTEWQIDAYIMTSASSDWPGTGSKTLYYSNNSYDEGYNIDVIYVKGIDTASPIVGSDASNGNVADNWSSSISSVNTGDVGIIAAYFSGESASTLDTNSQTVIQARTSFNYAQYSVAYKANTGTLSVAWQSGDNIVPIAFVLKGGS